MRARFRWNRSDLRIGVAWATCRTRRGPVEWKIRQVFIGLLPGLILYLSWTVETSIEIPPDATSPPSPGEAGDLSADGRDDILNFRIAYEAAQTRFAKWRKARSSPGFPDGPEAR